MESSRSARRLISVLTAGALSGLDGELILFLLPG